MYRQGKDISVSVPAQVENCL